MLYKNSNVISANVVNNTSRQATITDDEGTPSLSINDVTTSNENAANATFTVTLSAASGQTVTVS